MDGGAAASALLKPVVGYLLPFARKMRAERRAGQHPFSAKPDYDSLDRLFDAALARLGAIDANAEFWKKLLAKIGAAYVRPEFFERPSIQAWLGDEKVKKDLKILARTRLIGGEAESYVLERTREKYSEATGETAFRSTYAIAVVLSVLHVSALAVLTPGEVVIAGMLRDAVAEQREGFGKIEARIDRLNAPDDPLHGERLRDELSKIRGRRAIPGANPAEEIGALISRIENGQLGRAPGGDKAEVYYWAARILAPDARAISVQLRSYPAAAK
ncbi:MAG: hypothetical protein IH626_09505 [Rhodospirillales bacterium]|nr:hypothetical protein [Rhodospirillales bacterium]